MTEVPLVIYLDNERLVVGTAQVNEDGTINATLDEDIPPKVRRLIGGEGGDYSLGYDSR